MVKIFFSLLIVNLSQSAFARQPELSLAEQPEPCSAIMVVPLDEAWSQAKPVAKQAGAYSLYARSAFALESGDFEKAYKEASALALQSPPGCALDTYVTSLIRMGNLHSVAACPLFSHYDDKTDWKVLLMGVGVFDAVGQKEKACELLNFLEKTWPDNEHIGYHSVIRLVAKQDFVGAKQKIDNFLDTVKLRTKHAPFFLLKAQLLANQPKPDLHAALLTVNEGLAIAGNNPKLLQCKIALAQALQLKTEIGSSLEALVNTTQSLEMIELLATHYYEQKSFDKALEVLNRLPESIDREKNKAQVLAAMGSYAQALSLVDKVLQDEPGCESAVNLQKSLLWKTGDFSRLFYMSCQQATQSPTDVPAAREAAFLAQFLLDRVGAAQQLVALYDKNRDVVVLYRIMRLCQVAGDYKRALKAASLLKQKSRAQGHKDLLMTARCAKACVLAKAGAQDRARAVLSKEILRSALAAEPHRCLAMVCARSEPTRANELLSKSIQLEPCNPVNLMTQGYVSLLQGDWARATTTQGVMRGLFGCLAIQNLSNDMI